MKRWIVHTLERVAVAFITAFIAAAAQLPGGIWQSRNWTVAATTAFGVAVASIAGRQVGDKSSPALLPGAVEAKVVDLPKLDLAGAAVTTVVQGVAKGTGEAIEVLVSTVPGAAPLGEGISDTVSSAGDLAGKTLGSVVTDVPRAAGGLFNGLKRLFK